MLSKNSLSQGMSGLEQSVEFSDWMWVTSYKPLSYINTVMQFVHSFEIHVGSDGQGTRDFRHAVLTMSEQTVA